MRLILMALTIGLGLEGCGKPSESGQPVSQSEPSASTGHKVECEPDPEAIYQFSIFGGLAGQYKVNLILHQGEWTQTPSNKTRATLIRITDEQMLQLHQMIKEAGVFEMRSIKPTMSDGYAYHIVIKQGDTLCHQVDIPIEDTHPSPHADRLKLLFEKLEKQYGHPAMP